MAPRRPKNRINERRELLSGAILALACLIVAMVIGEGALRAASSNKYYVQSPGLHAIFRPLPDLVPGISGDGRFYINDLGIRGDPFSRHQTYRILAIGGSTTECIYLDNSEAWPYLLQEVLNSKLDHDRVWVGNVGKSGNSTRDHILQVTRLIDQYPRIDAITLLIGINDFLTRLAKDERYRQLLSLEALPADEYEELLNHAFSVRPGRDTRYRPGWDSGYPFYKRTEIWRRLRIVKQRYFDAPKKAVLQDDQGQVFGKWRLHRKNASSIRVTLPNLSTALEEYSRNVNTIINFAESKKIRVILVTQPYMWRSGLPAELRTALWMGGVGDYQGEIGHDYYSVEALAKGMRMYNVALMNICRNRNAECIDLEPQLAKDMSVFYDDAHFNENGSRKVAFIIADYLLRNKKQLAGSLK